MPKPWAKVPLMTYTEKIADKAVRETSKKGFADFKEIIADERLMGIPSYKVRL